MLQQATQLATQPEPGRFLSSRMAAGTLGVLVGALGGTLERVLAPGLSSHSVLEGAAYGLIFALLFGPRATSPGAGLIWGLGYAFLLWVAVPAGILPVPRARCLRWGCSVPLRLASQNWSPTSSATECRWEWHWAFWVSAPDLFTLSTALVAPSFWGDWRALWAVWPSASGWRRRTSSR